MDRWRRRLARWIDPDTLPGIAPNRLLSRDGASRGTALVVAGGGARSSFEIGALQYLYQHQRLAPVVISGTSAGAIIAAVLAQYSDPRDQTRALTGLEQIWSAMTDSTDMFAEQPWFTALRSHIPTWRKVVALRQRQDNRVSLTASLADLLAKPREAVARITGERQTLEGTHTTSTEAVDGATDHTRSDEPADTPPEHERHWTPAHALETLSTLWEAGRSSADLEAILRGAQQDRSAFTPGTIVTDLLDPEVFSPDRLGNSRMQLRIAVVALESGELRYVDEHGRLRDRQDRVLPGVEPVDLVDAVFASCAIPGVFPPVELAGEHYVDGGVRENVPAAVVLDRQDVDRCYVVVAAPEGVPASSSFAQKDLMEILVRSTAAIGPDEIQRDEVRDARQRGAVVIQPELDIHDIITIDPGLVSIAIDYGYLRAGDVCDDAGEARQARTRDVIQLRRLIWTTEDAMFGPEVNDDEVDVEEIAELKLRLRDLICDPGSAHLPATADEWWRTWERHPFPIEAEPSWPGARR